MKKIIIPISALFVVSLSHAQSTNLSTNENYIYSKTYLSDPSLPNPKSVETVQYIDGLGRPKQVVNVKASPLGRDVVTHIEYDGFGRQVKDYLPVPQSGTMNGAIVPNPLANATQPEIYGAEKIYAEKILENSPLDRIQQQIQVGNDWSSKPVKFEYDANTAGEVIKYTTTTIWQNNATKSGINYSGTFGAAQLYKNTITDEDGNKTIEFKNGQGQTLLIRKILSATENADTYYVYNEYDQLAWVIPPLLSKMQTWGQTEQDALAYEYRYDGRNRLVEKKIPGKGWEHMVYDKADRLIMTQDANFRPDKRWLFTKYDQFSRVIYTGITADPNERAGIQAYVDFNFPNNYEGSGSFTQSGLTAAYTSSNAFPTHIHQLLSVNYYDTYPSGSPAIPTQVLGQNVLPQDAQNSSISTKSFPTASFVKNIEDDNWTKTYMWYDTKGRSIGSYSINHLGGYTKTESELDFVGIVLNGNIYHLRKQGEAKITLKERFVYDSHNRLKQHFHQVDDRAEVLLTENSYNELSLLSNKKVGNNLQSIDYAYNIRGWMTGINSDQMSAADLGGKLLSYKIRYNEKLGITNPDTSLFYGKDVVPKYNGNIAEVEWKSIENIGNNPPSNPKRYGYAYDRLNRLTAGYYQNPNNPNSRENTEAIDYDVNGNITKLYRTSVIENGSTIPTNIDNLQYQYFAHNKSNKLTHIQDVSHNPTGYEGGGHEIRYDLNGNMTEMSDKGISLIRYNYLNLPRVLEVEKDGNKEVVINIKYNADGQKLEKVNTTTTIGINGYTTTKRINEYISGFHYLKIVNITPQGGSGSDAILMNTETGYAMERQAYSIDNDSQALIPVIFKNPDLQFFSTAEGFYDYKKDQYIYQYKDHLGNTRVSFGRSSTGDLEITDANDYYPFGMNHLKTGNAKYRQGSYKNYKYNGKELQETGMYDYGARFYMADIGRWGVVDELAEKFSRYSPYNYVVNDPINGIDPDGRDVIFLADSKAVPVAGHGAVIVGNEKDGWYYYSMNGTGEGSSAYGDSKNPDIGTPLGKGLSPKQAMIKANTINPVPSEKHHYDKFVTVRTTKEEDIKIKAAAAKAAGAKKYKVIGQSCACVMLDALNELTDMRSNNAWYIPKFIDPAPNNIMDYFNKEKGGGINFLNRFLLPTDKEIQVRKVGKLDVGPLIPEGVDNNKTQ